MLLQVSFPISDSEYVTANPFEEQFISVLMTGLVPKLTKAQKRRSAHARSHINQYRTKEGIPIIPDGLFELKSGILLPIYMDNVALPSVEPTCDYHKSVKLYKESIRLMSIEEEVIGWITESNIPKMEIEERDQLDRDICLINNYRYEAEVVELDLGKSLDEHIYAIIVSDPVPIRRSEKRGGGRSRRRVSSSNLSEDESQSSSSDEYYSSSEDGYDSRGNPHREEATNNQHGDRSEIDEDDELFGSLDGYDSSGDARVDKPRVDVDLTSLPDAIMEDVTNKRELTKKTSQGNRLDDVALLQMEKSLKSFLNGLLDMTRCPISRQQMVNPLMGEDSYSYEYSFITKWLEHHNSSPMTKCYLNMSRMNHDYTMEKVIRSLKEFNISQPMIDNIGTAPPPTVITTTTVTTTNVETMPHPSVSVVTPPSKSPIDPPAASTISPQIDPSSTNDTSPVDTPIVSTISPQIDPSSTNTPPGTSSTDAAPLPATTSEATTQDSQRKKKQKKQRNNRKVRKYATNVLKKHIADLQRMKLYETIHQKERMPSRPSFSMMHSLEDGFSIVMYSHSHRVNLESGCPLHDRCGIRIILPKWMAIIWHEGLLHSGARSRDGTLGLPLEDMRFFAYIWPLVDQYTRTSRGSSDTVSSESGKNVYRHDINNRICKHMYQNDGRCKHCFRDDRDEMRVIDLTNLPETSYKPGEAILGQLDDYGWVVVRGLRVTPEVNEAIKTVGKSKASQWHSIEGGANNRKMRYDHSQRVIRDRHWKATACSQFLGDIQHEVLDKVFPVTRYTIGGYNLLKNDGPIPYDQQAHTDYADRSP